MLEVELRIRAFVLAVLLAGASVGAVSSVAMAQSDSIITLPDAAPAAAPVPSPPDAASTLAPAPNDAPPSAAAALPIGAANGPPPSLTSGHCAVWSAAAEDDGDANNLTATACASTADDATAIGIQCPSAGQVRYYPQADDLPKGIKRGSKETLDFGVDLDHVTKVMNYDDANGVFFSALKKSEPLLTLLQSGGPLIVSSADLGSHTFRLLGSTAAMQLVFDGCDHPPKAAPVPVPDLPQPIPRDTMRNDQMQGDQYFGSPDGTPRGRRRGQPSPVEGFFQQLFGQ
jgi:hypothetical protein